MSTAINQKAYLQKYLSGPSKDKKKKKKKTIKGTGFKIIDDDVDLSKLRPLEGDELDVFGEGEDAPQVAGIIDERPEEVRKLEQFKTSSKWRVINQDDGFNSKLRVEEIKTDVKEVVKENEIIFGKMYSDSEDEQKNDSDPSPPRKPTKLDKSEPGKSRKPQNNSDSDFSPPRKNRETSPKRDKNTNDRSDVSPPRRHEIQKSKDRVRKQSRWGDVDEAETSRQRSTSPRGSKKRYPESPARKSKRKSLDSDVSPPRKSQKLKQANYDSDIARKSRKESSKKRNRSPDSDLSPPRKRNQSPDGRIRNDRQTNVDKNRRDIHSSDSDLSPPRKSKSQNTSTQKHEKQYKNRRKQDSDSDLSPLRKNVPRRDADQMNLHTRSSNSPPPSNKKMAKTLDGKMAGLQDARQLRTENEAFRIREEEAFKRMGDEVSGRNAKAVSRKGKRETSEERQKLTDKAAKQKELDEKYKKWGQGLKQIADQEARVQDYIHESSKPLARHRDDSDLAARLQAVERDGDPMLQYMRERKRERGELGPEKPMYKGNFPPNRFGVRPGYRWDGVDRSNGYEKKFFDQQSKRKAQEEDAYKWSTEDL